MKYLNKKQKELYMKEVQLLKEAGVSVPLIMELSIKTGYHLNKDFKKETPKDYVAQDLKYFSDPIVGTFAEGVVRTMLSQEDIDKLDQPSS